MQTLIVDPKVLLQVADRLEHLASRLPIDVAEIRRCLADLRSVWSGMAAEAAFARLRQLIGLVPGWSPNLAELDSLPAAERDRINRDRYGEHPALLRLSRFVELPDALLLGFDPSGDGRVIVAFGDPDTSRNVVTYVPGAGASLDGISGELERAAALRAAAGPDTSVIMWLGYDAPDFADAALETAARQAGEPLRRFQAGLVANHIGELGQQTVIGHSYGSLVVGVAERGGALRADDLVALGSPGMGVANAAQLRDPREVWACTARDDAIRFAPEFILGPDPDSKGFGANVFESAPHGHSGYFRPDNPALRSLATLATTGQSYQQPS